jgi:hypothetical protein
MSLFAVSTAVRVAFTDTDMLVSLRDGRTVKVPLSWIPRIEQATPAQRLLVEISPSGAGLHWPELDEDISVEGLLGGLPDVSKVSRQQERQRT